MKSPSRLSHLVLTVTVTMTLGLFAGQAQARKFKVENDSTRDYLYISVFNNNDSSEGIPASEGCVKLGKSERFKCGSQRCKMKVSGAYEDGMGKCQKRHGNAIKLKDINDDVRIWGGNCGDGLSCLKFEGG